MRSFTLAFLLGIIALQFFSKLPNLYWAIIILFSLTFIKWLPKYIRLITPFFLGFAWCLWFAHSHLAWELPSEAEGKTISVTGQIVSIPITSSSRTTFLFDIKKSKIKLSWQDPNLKLNVGDEWHLVVRLKKIHGTLNPGGSDYEAYAIQQNIRATGYVINHAENKLINSHWYHRPLDRMRQYLYEKINSDLQTSNTSPWISALAIGERANIASENWDVLRNTGTNHLMAIAGLHIGLMAGFIYSITYFCWRRSPQLMLKIPAQHAAATASLIIAIIYSALAGFSLPTQRACIMLAIFIITSLSQRNQLAWHGWCGGILCVLLLNPLSVLNESFWLSFVSVALIIFGVSGRLAPAGIWWKWGRIQWILSIGLVPLSIALFQECSLISFFANSIAIPWVGFLVMPLTFSGCLMLFFSEKIAGILLLLADKLLGVLWKFLTVLSNLSWGTWYHAAPNHWVVLLGFIGILLILSPAGFPGKTFGLIWLLPLIVFKTATPKFSEMSFTLLDVGQGLSAVLQTQNHILVFDTGAKWNDNFDMGASVVIPFLRTLNIKKIDMLVVSHKDNDHIGGASVILKNMPVISVKTSVPQLFTVKNVSYCLRGEKWTWDGVDFQFIYPLPDKLQLNNNSSCVLKVTNGKKTILLTGDIEKQAEEDLVLLEENNLAADIIIAPHHGSKTSGMNQFIESVHPKVVLFPIGYRNRYHFPHPTVIKKYQQQGALMFDTAKSGAIHFMVSDTISNAELYRLNNLHYWNIL